jgi:hypothetical protein
MCKAFMSWRDYPNLRRRARFIKWDGDYAIGRYGAKTVRIHKSQVTLED